MNTSLIMPIIFTQPKIRADSIFPPKNYYIYLQPYLRNEFINLNFENVNPAIEKTRYARTMRFEHREHHTISTNLLFHPPFHNSSRFRRASEGRGGAETIVSSIMSVSNGVHVRGHWRRDANTRPWPPQTTLPAPEMKDKAVERGWFGF